MGPTERRDRTQEVAGSSPASSIKRSCKREVFFRETQPGPRPGARRPDALTVYHETAVGMPNGAGTHARPAAECWGNAGPMRRVSPQSARAALTSDDSAIRRSDGLGDRPDARCRSPGGGEQPALRHGCNVWRHRERGSSGGARASRPPRAPPPPPRRRLLAAHHRRRIASSGPAVQVVQRPVLGSRPRGWQTNEAIARTSGTAATTRRSSRS